MRAGLRLTAAVVLVLVVLPAPPAWAAADPEADPQDRVLDVVREGRILPIVRREASISGDIRTSETPEQVQVELASDVLFAFDSADLSPEAGTRIAEVGARIASEATGAVQVVGHTDSVGEDAYNQALSEQRAAAVAQSLSAVAAADYQVAGRGESEPVAPNEVDGVDDPAGRALNRRVTITFSVAP